ncbi:hypothetical protein AX14_001257 [Amanita brunnescens Koide BX004]|nr:hypothetical protein AX14_001257 [Amanita brunnescens Koide BX004]
MSYIEAVSFACIPEVQDSSALGFYRPSYSFEEVRVKDYLRFYQTTGGPPPPCPTEPYTAEQRAALSLPPRFSPWKDPTAAVPPLHQPMPNGSNPLLDDQMVGRSMSSSQQELPRIQVYAPVRVGTEIYENISCEPRLRGYSVEELRWSAYRQGLKYAPVPVPTPPLGEEHPARTSRTPTVIISDGDETLEHISTHPDFSKHSPEELRLAFVRSGRELNSQHLLSA